MEVHVHEVSSTIRTVDDDVLMTPENIRLIVDIVLRAIAAQQSHAARIQSERRVGANVREQHLDSANHP